MRQRTLVAVTTTLATLGLVLSASAAPSSHSGRHAERQAPLRLTLEGVISDWDADAPSITVEDPDVFGGNRAARRLVRTLGDVDLGIGPRTRIVTEDDEGVRERITADDLFAELDESADDLDVEVRGLLVPGGPRVRDAAPQITAKRIVLHLPAPDEADDGSALPDDDAPPPDEGDTDPAF